MADYDAIVVGAGHNGLSAATILAKNGLSVLCLEKTNGPGGMAATKELFDGFKHNVGAWAMLVFRDEMLKLLELEDYGIELIRPRSSYCVFGAPEDPPLGAAEHSPTANFDLMVDNPSADRNKVVVWGRFATHAKGSREFECTTTPAIP